MIRLVSTIPDIEVNTVELLKIQLNKTAYPNDTLLWTQDGTHNIFSMSDGNAILFCPDGVNDELREFLKVISPSSVFTDFSVAVSLFGKENIKTVFTMSRKCDVDIPIIETDNLRSDEIYRLFCTDGLDMPSYEYFATDYCYRINHSFADVFALKDKCVAISFHTDKNCLINGIASYVKGYGSTALMQLLLRERGKTAYLCCKEELCGFYIKNGFKKLYKSAYWER